MTLLKLYLWLAEDVDFEDNLEKLGDPIGSKNNKETYESAGDHFFTLVLSFFVSGASQHGESTHD